MLWGTNEHGLSLPIHDIGMVNGIHNIYIPSTETNKTTANNNSNTMLVLEPAVHLTYNIDFDDDNDSIIQEATQLVAAYGQCRLSSVNDDDNV